MEGLGWIAKGASCEARQSGGVGSLVLWESVEDKPVRYRYFEKLTLLRKKCGSELQHVILRAVGLHL